MKNDEFELYYKFTRKLQKEKQIRDIDRKMLDIANSSRKRRRFDEQTEKISKQKKTRKFYKTRARALVFIISVSLGLGVGTKALYDEVAPIITVYVQNEADNYTLAEWFGYYNVSDEGYFLDSQIKREVNDGWFNEGPMPFDYTDPENLSITEDGRKVGAIVDYYNGFNRYLRSNIDKGYYETIYTQMERLASIGKDPNSIDSLYTFEELTEMLGKEEIKGMGVN